MPSTTLLLGDCAEQMRTLADNSIDSICTDPPYALVGTSGTGGFMGAKWDSELPTVEMWKEALRVAKPGAHLLAFGGTRTYHRLACAIEDAGWEVRDCIMWVYGCLSEDTEIATPQGWKRRGEIKVGDMVIAFDRAQGKTLSQPVQRVFDYDYDDEAYRIVSPLTDQLVSKNHRVLAEVNGVLDFVYAEFLRENDTVRVPVYCGGSRLSDLGVFIGHHEMTTASVSLTHYKGRMWCVSVPLGAIVARRNGKIFVTGNSGFPKSMDVSKAIDTRGGNPHLAQEIAKAIRAAREVRGWSKSEADEHFCHGTTNWSWYEGRNGKCRPPSTDMFARIVAEWTELASLADKVATAEREVIGKSAHKSGIGNATAGHYTVGGTKAVRVDITAPATPEAAAWSGWGTALKPAVEPIVVARKPLEGTVAANVLKYGTGAINIDACRVPTENETVSNHSRSAEAAVSKGKYGDSTAQETHQTAGQQFGRFPANLIHDGSDEVLACFPSSDKTAKPSVNSIRDGEPSADLRYTKNGGTNFAMKPGMRRPAEDTPARFFYCAKASRSERGKGNIHPTVKPLALMRYLVRLVTRKGGTVLDPFMGSGTTGIAALQEDMNFVGIEKDEHYYEIASRRFNSAPEVLPQSDPAPEAPASGNKQSSSAQAIVQQFLPL